MKPFLLLCSFLFLLPLSAQAQTISTGPASCAILADGSLKCWGYNIYGQLGQGDTASRGDGPSEMGANLTAINLGTGRTATAVASDYMHTCAVLDDASVKCWGANGSGELGQGDIVQRGDGPSEMGDNLTAIDLGTGRTATAVAIGGNHTCALLDDASVKCWGANNYGQLGQGDIVQRGDGASEMGDNLTAIDLGTGRTATAIAAGQRHTCAVLDDASVKCWGDNGNGQLGQGDTNNRGDGASEMGDNLTAIDLGTGRTATAIAAGGYHTCALLDDASVKCWGNNGNGRLGQGDTNNRGDGANEMGDNLAAIDLGTGRTATAVATGAFHTCAVLDDASVKCWGANGHGQLAQGDTANRGDAANQMGNNLTAIDLGTGRTAQAIATGLYNNTCAVLDDASVKCWGANNLGQLGQGDTVYRGDGANEMGDNLTAVDLDGAASLPVELTAFTAMTSKAGVTLAWATASETNNAGFDVEHRAAADTWVNVGWVAGHGTTTEAQRYSHTVGDLAPGRYAFRLKQVDYDGDFAYSPEVEVTVGVAGTFDVQFTSANPVADRAALQLTVPTAQQVTAEVLDVLGRRVALLHDGAVEAGAPLALSWDASAATPGVYLVRMTGERFAETRRIIVRR